MICAGSYRLETGIHVSWIAHVMHDQFRQPSDLKIGGNGKGALLAFSNLAPGVRRVRRLHRPRRVGPNSSAQSSQKLGPD